MLLLVGGGVAVGEAPTTATESAAPLEFLHPLLFTDKTQYQLGEPVYLRLVLANWSTGTIFALQGYLHPTNDLEVRVARAGELPKKYTGGLRREAFLPGMNVILRPRELTALRWLMCYEPDNKNGYLFTQPGTYVISCKARLTVNQTPRDLTFDNIEIQVVETTVEQQKVLSLILKPAFAADLQSFVARKETAKVWQEVAERFPKSLWAPYARMLLARHRMEENPLDSPAAFEQLQTVVRDYPDFYALDDVYYLCATAQDRLGRPLEALQWLNRLVREYPASSYIQPTNRLFHKYVYQDDWERRYTAWYLRE